MIDDVESDASARSRWAAIRPLVTATVMGGFAGLIAILTFQAMTLLQHLLWDTGTSPNELAPWRIVITILFGGTLLILLNRIAPSETMDELLADTQHPWRASRKVITVTAMIAIVSVAFGGAIGPEAGLLAVVAQCSAIVSRLIARDEAQARVIAQAGAAGALGGLYGSPPAAAALDGDRLTPSRIPALLAALSGFFVFVFVSRTVFAGTGIAHIPLPSPRGGAAWLISVPLLVGIAFGVTYRALRAGAERLVSALRRPWLATAIGTVLFAVIAAAVPLVRFSGHHEMSVVPGLVAEADSGSLWLLAAAKTVALVLCLAAGWRGGDIFPLLFIGAAAGGACAVLLPQVDPAAAVAAAMAATVTVGWRRPLAALLLLVLVTDGGIAMALLAGVGAGALVDRLLPGGAPAASHADDAAGRM